MASDPEALRDWHRLFGLLLTDFFTGSPFAVEVERDLSEQQQFLDVVIVRRGRGRFAGRLPDGLEELAEHNLITFKSHHEALDAWAMKELIGHYVAYRKLVSPSPSELLPEDQFRLYAVCRPLPAQPGGAGARGSSGRPGCMIAGGAPTQSASSWRASCRARRTTRRCTCSAPRRSWWASARSAYRRRSEQTSLVLGQLFERFEGRASPCRSRWKTSSARSSEKSLHGSTPQEQEAGTAKKLPPEELRETLKELPPEELRETLKELPLEKRLAGESAEQIRSTWTP